MERVEFNANRVFDPRTIMELAKRHGFELENLTVIGAHRAPQEYTPFDAPFAALANARYNLGIFTLVRRA
jgi:hypothetical protein